MSNKITKTSFQNHFRNKELRLDTIERDPSIPTAVKQAIRSVDRDGDGKISGAPETDRLFRALDRFDNDGSTTSMRRTPTLNKILDAATPPTATPATPNAPSMSITRASFQAALDGKQLELSALQENPAIPANIAQAARSADTNRDGKISGSQETNQLFNALDRFDNDRNANTMRRTTVLDALLGTATPATSRPPSTPNAPSTPNTPDAPAPTAPSAGQARFRFQPNAETLRRARNTDLGSKVPEKIAQYADTYKRAASLTGVPAELIAAIHANESSFGDYRASTRGPESGFGLDDRYVTTAWGNQQLAKHGLGRWERGTGTPTSILQSAVIAAEHLKRNAGYANISIDNDMTANDLAGASLAYMQGTRAAQNAHSRGSGWMFNTSDNNPHPLHPGGTSRTAGGRTIRVNPSRKEGLLRWDALLPLIQERLR